MHNIADIKYLAILSRDLPCSGEDMEEVLWCLILY